VPLYRNVEPRTSTTAIFRPLVITYDRTGALTDASKKPTEQKSVTRTEHPDDRRSVIARVVTKPYDWLKAVGSKLH
jgi:hypothetical protein